MLTRIDRIKNLGVFANHTWDGSVPSFERYNVIYGENGTGKTTLSRLFECLKDGQHPEYSDLDYKISSQSEVVVSGTPTAKQIRVFNSDYIQANIGQLDGALKHILVIGEENKAVAESLEKDQAEITKREILISQTEKKIKDLTEGRGKIFTGIAKTISEAASGSSIRNYRKNNAEAAYAVLNSGNMLSDVEITARQLTLRQEHLDALDSIKLPTISNENGTRRMSEVIPELLSNAKSLCARSALSEAIERLKENPEISAWVEAGYNLHRDQKSVDCEFCGQTVPRNRWNALSTHFSSEDQKLKQEIEECISSVIIVRDALDSISVPDRTALYSDLRAEFDVAKSQWRSVSETIQDSLDSAQKVLSKKLLSRTETFPFDVTINLEPAGEAVNSLRELIKRHNEKSSGFENAKQKAWSDLEKHYLLSIQNDVTAQDQKIEQERMVIVNARNGSKQLEIPSLDSLKASVAEKKSQLSNAHKAGEDLTSRLHTFLGRNDLVFKSGEDGYRLFRNGKIAKRLSEGERTAIAFVYFTVHLSDQDFSITDGIVIVDDPISSLDANSIFQAFSCLKNAVKDAKQIFLLTHNFSFLRLLINWVGNIPKKEGKSRFYMLVCDNQLERRESRIVELDKTLQNHPTEYHFLFKLLSEFQTDGKIASCYHIPNVVRKVLETFLDFYQPSKDASLYSKLSSVDFDENKKTSIYKFSNTLLHFTGQGFDPALVQESKNNAAYLLEMIKALSPQHYSGMISSIAA
jgi:wobble nucleotide-excising tRNase